MKLKTGDKVKIKSNIEIDTEFWHDNGTYVKFTNSKDKFSGKIVTIKNFEICMCDDYYFHIEEMNPFEMNNIFCKDMISRVYKND